jgi:hypothetical protein
MGTEHWLPEISHPRRRAYGIGFYIVFHKLALLPLQTAGIFILSASSQASSFCAHVFSRRIVAGKLGIMMNLPHSVGA